MFGARSAPVLALLAWLMASGATEPALDRGTEGRVDEHPGHPDGDETTEPVRAEARPGCQRDERRTSERANGANQGDAAAGARRDDPSRH